MIPRPQLIIRYTCVCVRERTVELAGFDAENVTGGGSVAAKAIERAGIEPLLSAGAKAGVDKDVFGEGVGNEIGIGVIGAPFVSDAVDGAVGVANEEAGFETLEQIRIRVVDWEIEMFDKDGAIGE